ncbi:hypothetical protein [Acidaminococcus massiliensis]|uniref:hypothetical protein n=1 Tax=Acidaminococcus massiliensis TaxID=1852375 RepID=UPI00266D5157|nr:hypothetical protein [Acidaminococcus massiliensis]
MSKTDKELAAEITIAVINANPTIIYRKDTAAERVIPAPSAADAADILETIFNRLKSL